MIQSLEDLLSLVKGKKKKQLNELFFMNHMPHSHVDCIQQLIFSVAKSAHS